MKFFACVVKKNPSLKGVSSTKKTKKKNKTLFDCFILLHRWCYPLSHQFSFGQIFTVFDSSMYIFFFCNVIFFVFRYKFICSFYCARTAARKSCVYMFFFLFTIQFQTFFFLVLWLVSMLFLLLFPLYLPQKKYTFVVCMVDLIWCAHISKPCLVVLCFPFSHSVGFFLLIKPLHSNSLYFDNIKFYLPKDLLRVSHWICWYVVRFEIENLQIEKKQVLLYT